jgi:hypothetical protein
MPDSNNSPNNGAAPDPSEARPASLRDVAESAWQEVVEAAPDDDGEDDSSAELIVDEQGRTRDKLGRWMSKDAQPGEAEDEPPSPDEDSAPQQPPPDPARGSNQAPQNWSAQDRETFAALPPEGQEFLLRRHTGMERDYQSRVQAAHGAVQFAQAVSPIFQDPVIAGSLQQQGLAPLQAIEQWASFHHRAMSPDPKVRQQLLGELADRMGLVNPAMPGQSPSGPLSPEDLKDPAIRHFADTLGRTFSETQALRAEIQRMQQGQAQQAQAESLKVARWGIDSFAEEKDANGQPLRPDFDDVLPALIEMYRLNPQLDIRQAYEEARWRTPSIRARLVQQQQQSLQQRQAHDRARQAARSNVRGMTSRVGSAAANGADGPKGLRATLESAADEVGF